LKFNSRDTNLGRRRSGENIGAKVFGITRWRYYLVLLGLTMLPVVALWQIARLQVVPDVDRGYRFLQGEGDARMVRSETIPGYRGAITDRHGHPLAVSTPVVSVCADPQILRLTEDTLATLAGRLGVTPDALARRIATYADKEFMYLSRRMTPEEADKILELRLPGVFKQTEYKRYYPAAEVTAQVVGFTDVDDIGQEGIELAFNDWLAGFPGTKKVVKDRKRHVIKELQLVRSEKPGNSLSLSIDLRLQYSAYRELKSAITRFRAASGSVVVLDVRTGEVLAMVNH
jgi:cell division protein FtsI (penicillin-binding protein 3)